MKKLILFAIFFSITTALQLTARDAHCYLTPFTKYCKGQIDAEMAAKATVKKAKQEAKIAKKQAKEEVKQAKQEAKAEQKYNPSNRHWYNLWRFWDMRSSSTPLV